MVLGGRPPGRVGRRRIHRSNAPLVGAFVVFCRGESSPVRRFFGLGLNALCRSIRLAAHLPDLQGGAETMTIARDPTKGRLLAPREAVVRVAQPVQMSHGAVRPGDHVRVRREAALVAPEHHRAARLERAVPAVPLGVAPGSRVDPVPQAVVAEGPRPGFVMPAPRDVPAVPARPAGLRAVQPGLSRPGLGRPDPVRRGLDRRRLVRGRRPAHVAKAAASSVAAGPVGAPTMVAQPALPEACNDRLGSETRRLVPTIGRRLLDPVAPQAGHVPVRHGADARVRRRRLRVVPISRVMVLGAPLRGLRSLGPHRSDLVVIVPRACGRVRRSQATGRVVAVVLLRVVVVGVMVALAAPGRMVLGRMVLGRVVAVVLLRVVVVRVVGVMAAPVVPGRVVPGRPVAAAAVVPAVAAAMQEATVGVAAGRQSVVVRSR